MIRTILIGIVTIGAAGALAPALAFQGAKAGSAPTAKLEPYADSQGLCAVTLPAGWYFGDNPGMGMGLVV